MSTRLTAFVPEYVDLTGFNKAAWNSRYDFVDVDSASFNSEAELARLGSFIVIERDHIACYSKTATANPMKLKFTPGSSVLGEAAGKLGLAYMLLFNSSFFDNQVEEVYKEPAPLLCFVEKDEYNAGNQLNDRNFALFSLEPYSRDSQGNIDIGKLANMAKERDGYEYDVFVVKNGDKYRAHSLDETISHTLIEVSKMVTMLRVGSCTIHDLARIDGRVPLKQQSQDFKLCDRHGIPVREGEEFWLQIYADYTANIEENYDTSATSFEDKYRNTDCIKDFDVLSGGCGDPEMLTHEVIDGITYLKMDDQYVRVDNSIEIYLSSTIPPKEHRVQIEYNHRGDLMLSKWGGATYASCDYVKASVGIIEVKDVDIKAEEFWPMVLRLHRC